MASSSPKTAAVDLIDDEAKMLFEKARSTKTTTRVVAAAQQEVSGFYWWGSENMDAEVGSDKAERHPADIQPEYGWRA